MQNLPFNIATSINVVMNLSVIPRYFDSRLSDNVGY